MKKPLPLILAALIVLVPAFALAAGVTYGTYRNEANGYSIDYPAEWTLLSEETIRSSLDSLAESDGASASVAESYKARTAAMDDAVFMSPDGAVNAAIGCQSVSMKLTSEVFIKSAYPAVLQQLQSAFADYAILAEPKVEKIGKTTFVKAAGKCTVANANCVMLQAFHCTDKNLYTITFAIDADRNPDLDALQAIFKAMLASFIPV